MARKWIAVLVVGLLAAQTGAEERVLKTQEDKVSYGIGADVARNFKRHGIEIKQDLFMKGLEDVLSGGNLLMSEKELQETLARFQSELRMKQAELRRKMMQPAMTGVGGSQRPSGSQESSTVGPRP